MNYFIFIIKSALEDFSRNKIRTALTSLGILIGVASVVLLIAFGLGLKKFISNQFESLGTNLVIVLPGKIFSNGQFRQGGTAAVSIQFEEKDITLLKKVRGASLVVPIFTKAASLTAGSKTELSDIFISSADVFAARNLTAEYGRVYDKSDLEKMARVVVLGPKIAGKLFASSENALNKNIKINGQNFRVVGILESKGGGGFGGPDFDSFTYAPYKSMITLNPNKKFIGFYLKASDSSQIETVKQGAKAAMLKRYKEDDFSIAEQTEILNAISSIFSVLNLVLVAIAAISLIVGGVGIMNIMYVSVIERIREIGIRRALGATRKDVLLQFLAEAVILSILGGLAGLILSALIVIIIRNWFPAYINLVSVIISLGVSSFIGVIFGVFPARKAANLSPIEAIRFE